MGDYGDVIYLLPCLKLVAEQEGEPVILYAKNGLRDHDPFIPRLPGIQRLVRFQSYVKDFLPWNGEPIDYDTSRFRDPGYPFGVTLAELQARAIGLLPDSQHWLFAESALSTKDRIVIARSSRYQNHYFPWKELLDTYQDRMVFIGLEQEHAAFCTQFGKVPYLRTIDLLEAAEVIAGSAQFIGNQSAPLAVSHGLGHPSLVEVCLWCPDCIYKRPDASYCYDGQLDLNLFGRWLNTKPVDLRPRATMNETPPGGWRVEIDGFTARSYSFDMVIREIKTKLIDKVPANLLEMIIEQSSIDMPPGEPEYYIRQVRTLLT